jgi:hypothetical protein
MGATLQAICGRSHGSDGGPAGRAVRAGN